MLTPAEVERIAHLARLTITDDEKVLYARQLSQVLAYAEQLALVNVDGVAATATVLPVHSILRSGDRVSPSLSREDALRNAPRTDGISFEVPAALTDED